MLIDAGADVNSKDEYGGTALSLAAKRGNEGIVKMLKDNGVPSKETWVAWYCPVMSTHNILLGSSIAPPSAPETVPFASN
jgi:hypothetical protein